MQRKTLNDQEKSDIKNRWSNLQKRAEELREEEIEIASTLAGAFGGGPFEGPDGKLYKIRAFRKGTTNEGKHYFLPQDHEAVVSL